MDFLFIDDLGSELVSENKASDFACHILFRIVNNRGNSELFTFVSSNKNLSDISQNYGERISLRLAEYNVLPLTGEPKNPFLKPAPGE